MKGYYTADLTHMEDAGSDERVSFWLIGKNKLHICKENQNHI